MLPQQVVSPPAADEASKVLCSAWLLLLDVRARSLVAVRSGDQCGPMERMRGKSTDRPTGRADEWSLVVTCVATQ